MKRVTEWSGEHSTVRAATMKDKTMACPECNGTGTAIYYAETDRDDYSVTVKRFEDICHTCHGSGVRTVTNGDRIRAMSDEELAESGLVPCPYNDDGFGECKYGWHDREQTCEECIAEWLKQPAENKV